jgi:hypothetical protein
VDALNKRHAPVSPGVIPKELGAIFPAQALCGIMFKEDRV